MTTCDFDYQLAASEIAQLYREPFAMFEHDPIELWAATTQVTTTTTAPPEFLRPGLELAAQEAVSQFQAPALACALLFYSICHFFVPLLAP